VKLTEKEALAILSYVEARRRNRLTRRRVCELIVSERSGDFSGEIDGGGWVRGEWTDDPTRPAAILNYETGRALENVFYQIRRAMLARRVMVVRQPKRAV